MVVTVQRGKLAGALRWLFANWMEWLDSRSGVGFPTSNQSFRLGFCQTFSPHMSQRQPTTPWKANTCSCGVSTSAGIVNSSESWPDQERLYHQWGPMPCHPCATNIDYPYESTEVFRDEFLYTLPIQRQASIYNWCQHLCPSLPLFFVAALWCHRGEMKMNLHPQC